MKFNLYTGIDGFKADVYDILLEDEVCNNLPIGIINGKSDTAANWLLSTVTDDLGVIVLIAVCTPPFNLLLVEPARPGDDGSALKKLSGGLKDIGFTLPGILAKNGLARRFANEYSGINAGVLKSSLVLMKLDKPEEYNKAPGFCRFLTEEDLLFTPSWEHEFCIDCNLPLYTPKENEDRIRSRLGKDSHFIWVDKEPVSQAVYGRETPNSAVVSWVYTPPQLRERGYATSVVAEVTKSMLKRGKKSCCLFADAANPTSRSVYRKLGYHDLCMFDEIKFDMR